MHKHASWEAPYSITDGQLRSAHFDYRSYFLFSVISLPDGIYTYGFFGMVTPTKRLRPKLVELSMIPREGKE